jgi:cysteine sulfinate desulfinase/cysteine desulfurase-like protein
VCHCSKGNGGKLNSIELILRSHEVIFCSVKYDHERVSYLSQRMVDKVASKLDHVIRNGDPVQTYPGCLNLSFAFVEGMDEIY